MGNKRKVKTLKGKILKNKNNFSTSRNIHVIDESVTNTKPSQKSEALEKTSSEYDSINEQKVDQSRTDEVVSKKVKKRKNLTSNDSPEKKSKSVSIQKKVTETTDMNDDELFDEDEANIKDEDIDKFCDEIDDADNAQYEAWVKLVEDKLHEKKK